MAKNAIVGYRFDEEMRDLIERFATFLGISRTKLQEDALRAAVLTHSVASTSHNEEMRELVSRYGPDAPITVRLDEDGVAQVLIDGDVPDDVRGHIAVEEAAGLAHVFLEVLGWHPGECGTVRLGPVVLLARPMIATCRLPWPADPTVGLVARLGELVTQPAAGDLVPMPANATV